MSIKFNLKVISIGVLLIAFLFPPLSLAQITFERTYGGYAGDYGLDVQQTIDEGFIITGSTQSFFPGPYDLYFIRTNPSGDTLWTRTYGTTSGGDYGRSVQQTQDGGFIIAGLRDSFGIGPWDVFLVKTNDLGDTLWTKTYGGSSDEEGHSIQQTTDGGYIIVGYTGSFGAGSNDVYLIKTDSTGDSLWTRTYGGIYNDVGLSVQQTSDGGYILGGYTGSFGVGSVDAYLIKTNSVGDTLWTRNFGGTGWEQGWSVQQTLDGGYILGGYTGSFGAGGRDVWILKTDYLGDTLWTRTYGGANNDDGFSVQQTSDGGYIISGVTRSFGAGLPDAWLLRTNSWGDTLWTRTYGGTGDDRGYSLDQTYDGGFIITGVTGSFGAGAPDVYLIKTCPDGTVRRCKKSCLTFDDLDETISNAEINNEGVRNSLQAKANNGRRQYDRGNIKALGNVLCALLHEVNGQDGKHIDPTSAQDLRECIISIAENLRIPLPCQSEKSVTHVLYPNFPNPVFSKTKIGYEVKNFDQSSVLSLGSKQKVVLKIYDLLGREVRSLVDEEQESGYYSVEWNGEDSKGRDVPSGIYFYRLQTREFTSTRKMILLK
jgi:hypothetical protein